MTKQNETTNQPEERLTMYKVAQLLNARPRAAVVQLPQERSDQDR
jgi:hypothetical protein